MLLCKDGYISEPLVYLSLFFKENRTEYYEQLQTVRTHGTWEEWIEFFLDGIAEVTEEAYELIDDSVSRPTLYAAASQLSKLGIISTIGRVPRISAG